MTLSFMIKKKCLAEKVEEQIKTGSFHERRAFKPFWRKRIGSTHQWHLGGDAVFICGRYAYYADILNITIEETPPGIDVVVPGKLCYNIECKFQHEELETLSAFLSDE